MTDLERIELKLDYLIKMVDKKWKRKDKRALKLSEVHEGEDEKIREKLLEFIGQEPKTGILHGELLKKLHYYARASVVNALIEEEVVKDTVRREYNGTTKVYFLIKQYRELKTSERIDTKLGIETEASKEGTLWVKRDK